jgi:SH3 domain protein
MKKCLWATVVGFFLLSALPVWAKSMYITDRIEVGVRSGIGIEQKFIGTIKTGDRVEVLEGDQNWSKVKLANGTVGWVASRFLVDQVKLTATVADPKVLDELKGLKEQNLVLAKQLEGYKQDREKLLKENEESKKAQQALQQEKQGRVAPEINQLKTQNAQLEKQVQELKQQAAASRQQEKNQVLTEQIGWFLAGSGVLFVGLILGWLASRGKKKGPKYY